MKKNKLWSFALAGALAVSNLSAVAIPMTAFAAMKLNTSTDNSFIATTGASIPVAQNTDADTTFDIAGTGLFIALTDGSTPVAREYKLASTVSTGARLKVGNIEVYTTGTDIHAATTAGAKIGDTARLYVTDNPANIGTDDEDGEYVDIKVTKGADLATGTLTIKTGGDTNTPAAGTVNPLVIDKRGVARLEVTAGLSGIVGEYGDKLEWTVDNSNFEVLSTEGNAAYVAVKNSASVIEGETATVKAQYYGMDGKIVAAAVGTFGLKIAASDQSYNLTLLRNVNGTKTDVGGQIVEIEGKTNVNLLADVDLAKLTKVGNGTSATLNDKKIQWSIVSGSDGTDTVANSSLIGVTSTDLNTKSFDCVLDPGTSQVERTARIMVEIKGKITDADGNVTTYYESKVVTFIVKPLDTKSTVTLSKSSDVRNPINVSVGDKLDITASIETNYADIDLSKTTYAWVNDGTAGSTNCAAALDLINPTTKTVSVYGKKQIKKDEIIALTVTLNDKNGNPKDTITKLVYLVVSAPDIDARAEKNLLYLDIDEDGTDESTVIRLYESGKEVKATANYDVSADGAATKGHTNGFGTSTGTYVDATIATSGELTIVGKKAGTGVVTISNTVSGASVELKFTVASKNGVRATGVELDKSSITLDAVDDIDIIKAVVTPANVADATKAAEVGSVTAESSDKSVVTVRTGNVAIDGSNATNITVTAKGPGKAVITVTADDKLAGTYTAKCEVVVTGIKAIKITGSSEVKVGSTTTLTANVDAYGNASKSVTWESSDASVATIDADGVVTGIKEGTAQITATSIAGTPTSEAFNVSVVTKTEEDKKAEDDAAKKAKEEADKKAAEEAAKKAAEEAAKAGLQKNATASVSGTTYTGLGNKTVSVKSVKNKKSVTIKKTVKINGQTHKVTKVAKGAFKGSKVQNVTIDAKYIKKAANFNVNAFKGAKNLKSVKIKNAKKGGAVWKQIVKAAQKANKNVKIK